MQITLDTNELTATDVAILRALLQDEGVATATPAASKPAKAAEKPVKPAEEPASTDGPTLEDAVAIATKLVSTGKAADVKAALEKVGAKRVSELEGDSIAEFVAALNA